MRIILNLPAKRNSRLWIPVDIWKTKGGFLEAGLAYSLPYPSPPQPIPSLPCPAVNKIGLDPWGMAARMGGLHLTPVRSRGWLQVRCGISPKTKVGASRRPVWPGTLIPGRKTPQAGRRIVPRRLRRCETNRGLDTQLPRRTSGRRARRPAGDEPRSE